MSDSVTTPTEPLGRVVDMELNERGLTVAVEYVDQEGYERLMRTWEQTERAICLALEVEPRASLDADTLTMAMDHVDMAQFWIREPRDISDPPSMQRMTFDRAGYAGALAAEYARLTEGAKP